MAAHDVVIAGGGPTGLMLAAELKLAGADPVIVERRATQDLDGSRAGGLHVRTLEVLDQRGVAERFAAEGQLHPGFVFSQVFIDFRELPSRWAGVLALWQSHIERLLAEWVLGDLGVPIRRGREVVGFDQDEDGVDVELSEGEALRARYLVGCDGGRSLVRKAAGIDFPGLAPSTSWMIAEVDESALSTPPPAGFHHDAAGRQHAFGQREAGEPFRAVLMEPEAEHAADPTIDDLRALLVQADGTDFGLREARWVSRFTDMSRQAAAYRTGRVLLAGDAAHLHPPQGGQGLNVGVQDAVNLGWKLAQVVRGTSPASLLDTYHAERHPIGARLLENTEAQVALSRPDARSQSLRNLLGQLLDSDEPRRRIAAMLTGLDVAYDLGEGHPLLGRRMPDLDLRTAAGATRVYELLHEARPLLLQLGGGAEVDLGPWAARVRRVEATTTASCPLPVLGEVDVPALVLVRPDGHVAWTGDGADAGLTDALATWCGAPVAA
jgi:3-(3-hydroxy-phenyl)propionate hydroxylase